MEIKHEEVQNNIFISQTSLKDSIFSKDTIKYDIIIKYPDGSTLRNYNDDQYPVIPFCLDEDSIKADMNYQNLRSKEKKKIILIQMKKIMKLMFLKKIIIKMKILKITNLIKI